jgi:hypothetical protein
MTNPHRDRPGHATSPLRASARRVCSRVTTGSERREDDDEEENDEEEETKTWDDRKSRGRRPRGRRGGNTKEGRQHPPPPLRATARRVDLRVQTTTVMTTAGGRPARQDPRRGRAATPHPLPSRQGGGCRFFPGNSPIILRLACLCLCLCLHPCSPCGLDGKLLLAAMQQGLHLMGRG